MKSRISPAKIALVALIFLGANSTTEAAVNLLQNGSFETGNFSGWSETGLPPDSLEYSVVPSGDYGYTAPDGNYYVAGAAVAPPGPPGYLLLKQTITDTPGAKYKATGWFVLADAGPRRSLKWR